jgi:hypothetical protein
MKFSEVLEDLSVPEWSHMYMCYSRLNRFITIAKISMESGLNRVRVQRDLEHGPSAAPLSPPTPPPPPPPAPPLFLAADAPGASPGAAQQSIPGRERPANVAHPGGSVDDMLGRHMALVDAKTISRGDIGRGVVPRNAFALPINETGYMARTKGEIIPFDAYSRPFAREKLGQTGGEMLRAVRERRESSMGSYRSPPPPPPWSVKEGAGGERASSLSPRSPSQGPGPGPGPGPASSGPVPAPPASARATPPPFRLDDDGYTATSTSPLNSASQSHDSLSSDSDSEEESFQSARQESVSAGSSAANTVNAIFRRHRANVPSAGQLQRSTTALTMSAGGSARTALPPPPPPPPVIVGAEALEIAISQQVLGEFVGMLERELQRVDIFYHEQSNRVKERVLSMSEQVTLAKTTHAMDKGMMKRFKMAFRALYRDLTMTSNFAVLNSTGFLKIVKKFNKNFPRAPLVESDPSSSSSSFTSGSPGDRFVTALRKSSLASSRLVDNCVVETATMYANLWTGGDLRAAEEQMIGSITSEQEHRNNIFILGLLVGICLPVLGTAAYELYQFSGTYGVPMPQSKLAATVFRISSAVAVMLTGLAINVFIFRRLRINYAYIFEVSMSDHLHHYQFFSLAAYSLIVLAFSLLGYTRAAASEARRVAAGEPHVGHVWTTFWIFSTPVAYVLWLFSPFRVLFYSTRRYFLTALWRMVCAPFYPVVFMDFYLADQLTSVGNFFVHLRYAACFTIDPNAVYSSCSFRHDWLLTAAGALPSWFRFLQCLRRYRDAPAPRHAHPHLVNAGKYFGSLLVAVLQVLDTHYRHKGDPVWTPLRVLWLIVNLLSTVYRLGWDVFMDWGLGKRDSRHPFLRNRLLYRSPVFYYAAIGVNFFLRFFWTMSFYAHMHLELWASLTAFLELVRRIGWNLLRVENEQIGNAQRFKASVEVPLPFSDTIVRSPMSKVKGGMGIGNLPGVSPKPFDELMERYREKVARNQEDTEYSSNESDEMSNLGLHEDQSNSES